MTEEHARYDTGQNDISPAAMLPFGDLGYVAPTTADVRAALRRANLTGSQAGQLVGVDGRTVRKWTGGEREMPYSAWRLLLIEGKLLEGHPARDIITDVIVAKERITFSIGDQRFATQRDEFAAEFELDEADETGLETALMDHAELFYAAAARTNPEPWRGYRWIKRGDLARARPKLAK